MVAQDKTNIDSTSHASGYFQIVIYVIDTSTYKFSTFMFLIICVDSWTICVMLS